MCVVASTPRSSLRRRVMTGVTPMLALLGVLLPSSVAEAIRPFVTDDARVVGVRLAQLETWLLLDRLSLEHNLLVALGPTDWLEVTLGMVHGGTHTGPKQAYSLTGPVLQAKALLLPTHDSSWPGLAVAAGTLAPAGFGPFRQDGWGAFAYAALTESLFEEGLLIHANVGIAVGYERLSEAARMHGEAPALSMQLTTGLGAQVRIIAGLHGVAELYYGDPYDARAGYSAMQTGVRYIFGEHVQIDGTFGSALASVESHDGEKRLEQWGTVGLRLVSHELW
jgi:hypothetical protein